MGAMPGEVCCERLGVTEVARDERPEAVEEEPLKEGKTLGWGETSNRQVQNR